ncbi:MAG: XisI protein [Blastocatellia bacterium]
MDKMTKYRETVKQILTEHVDISRRQAAPDVEKLLIADDEHGHYIWLRLGWKNGQRQNSPVIQARVKDGKIWVEEDWTDICFVEQLLEAGVPKEDIVLAFHAPELREYTEFAVA